MKSSYAKSKSKRTTKKSSSRVVTVGYLNKFMAMRQEHKYFDYGIGYSVVDYNGTVYHLSDVPQGDTDSTRDGDTIAPSYLSIRGQVHGADSSNAMRIVVFRYKQDSGPNSNDEEPVPSVILQSTVTATANAPYAPFHHDYRVGNKVFDVLADRLITVCGDVSNAAYAKEFKIMLPLTKAKKPIQFTNNTYYYGVNKIYLLVISDSGTVSHPAITFQSRLTFTDS